MKHSPFSLFAILGFLVISTGCQVDSGIPNFERMSSEELAAYNASQPLLQKIVCLDDERSFSRVRRRTCATVEAIYGSAAQIDQISVLSN